MQHTPSDDAADRGAENLLIRCVGVRRGERILIAHEPASFGYFDDRVRARVVAAAQRLGLIVETRDVGFCAERPTVSQDLRARIAANDVTVFIARLGDQLRFAGMPPGRIAVCFAIDEAMLASPFGTLDYRVFSALKDLVNAAQAQAGHVRVTCPAGSDFSGRPDMSGGADTTVMRFPVSVFTPVPADGFSGRVVLPGFLAGTGSRYYDRYMVRFDGPVTARFARGRLTGFDGARRDVARAGAQYDRVAARFGLDRDAVHSWHAGIHPGCAFPDNALTHMEQWSGAAFGNPRILHFHTCGADAPGEISWNVIDPTVWIDDVAVWENGVLHPGRLPGGAALLRDNPAVAALFAAPAREIGLSLCAPAV